MTIAEEWEPLLTRVAALIISLVVLFICWQSLSWDLITTEQFLLVLWAVLAAWGIGIVGAGTFKMGKKTGYQLGYRQGLEFTIEQLEQKKKS